MTPAPQTDVLLRRTETRLGLGIPARLLCLEGLQWVTLVDLSPSGARLVLDARTKVTGGMLCWLGFQAFGDPVWQREDELALHFDGPICPAWLLETRRRMPVGINAERASARTAFGAAR